MQILYINRQKRKTAGQENGKDSLSSLLWHKRVSGTKEFSDTKVAWIYDEMKKDSSVTTKLLSERSGIPLRTVRRAIDELTEKGYVIREGGRKSAMGRLR